MRKSSYLIVVAMALCVSTVIAQDEGEKIIKKALEGRQILVKMDLPAVETGVPMILDDTNISFDEVNYKKLLKEYGVGTAKGTRARITGVRVSKQGIEIDLDGGGMATRDWFVGNVKLVPPEPLGRSDREVELEHQIAVEANPNNLVFLKSELDFEQQSRITQDHRNMESFQRVANFRSKYIEENRKNWGSKLIVVIRTRKPNVMMRDMVKSLAQYAELLPREKTTQ